MSIQTCSALHHKASRPQPRVVFDMVLSSTFISSYPFMMCCLIRKNGCHFLIPAHSTAVVKVTSKFKWRLTLPALSLFPLQTSMLKIYSVGDKQDAAAHRVFGGAGNCRVFLLMSCESGPGGMFLTLSTAPSKDTLNEQNINILCIPTLYLYPFPVYYFSS